MIQESEAQTPDSFSYLPAEVPLIYGGDQRKQPRNVRHHYKSKCVLGMSITQIVLGCLCIVVQVIDMSLDGQTAFIGAGIWAGIMITTFLVMSIIGSAISTGPISIGTLSSIIAIDPPFYTSHVSTAMNATMVFASITSSLLLIISAGYACHGLCPDEDTQGSVVVAGHVQHISGPSGQQRMIIRPMTQPIPGESHIVDSDAQSMITVMPGQQAGFTNPMHLSRPNSEWNASAPPAYEDPGCIPEYEIKQPFPA